MIADYLAGIGFVSTRNVEDFKAHVFGGDFRQIFRAREKFPRF
jgi:hypothetical protein